MINFIHPGSSLLV